jgi:hypothetical protein
VIGADMAGGVADHNRGIIAASRGRWQWGRGGGRGDGCFLKISAAPWVAPTALLSGPPSATRREEVWRGVTAVVDAGDCE